MTDIRKHLGARLKALRKGHGLTQEALGEAVGISRNSIQEIEKGKAWPHFDNLAAMATRLGVTPAAFFAEAPLTEESQFLAEISAYLKRHAGTAEAERFLRIVRAAMADDQPARKPPPGKLP